MARVVLAMSGGVDSSVAAHLLLQQGHEVIGVFMRHGVHSPAAACAGGSRRRCCRSPTSERTTNRDAAVPRTQQTRAASRIGWRSPLRPRPAGGICADHRLFCGRVHRRPDPNPCVMCNNWLKFGKLFDYADSVGAEFVATGHYARLTPSSGSDIPQLQRGVDAAKDQSYVLFGVERRMLRRMLLPVGEYEKPQIRELAGQLGLRVADKPDSQEICFVPTGEHDQFVRQHRGADIDTSGELVTPEGRVLGRHAGIERFTIGQRRSRRGAGRTGFCRSHRTPDPSRRHRATRRLGSPRLDGRPHQLAGRSARRALPLPSQDPLQRPDRTGHGRDPSGRPAWPPFRRAALRRRPGQAVVCYDGDRVLGGGWIEWADRARPPEVYTIRRS